MANVTVADRYLRELGSSSFPRDPSRAAVILCVKLEAIAPHAIPKWAAVIMRVAKAVASHAIPKWAA